MSLHQEIAESAFGHDEYVLVCHEPNCLRFIEPSTDLMAYYLKNGWPKCHGQTMELVRVEETQTD